MNDTDPSSQSRSNGAPGTPARDTASYIVRVRRERVRLEGPFQGVRLELEDVQNHHRQVFETFDDLVAALSRQLKPFLTPSDFPPISPDEGEP